MRVTTIFAFTSLLATSISANDIPALSHASTAASSHEVHPVQHSEKRAMLLGARAATTARVAAERKGAVGNIEETVSVSCEFREGRAQGLPRRFLAAAGQGHSRIIVEHFGIFQSAVQIKVPKAEAKGKLNPQLIGGAPSQASKLKDDGTGAVDAVKLAIKGIQPGPAASLVDGRSKIADLQDKNAPVPLDLISDILPKLEAQLFAAAGQNPAQGEQESPLENDQVIEAFAETSREQVE
ncbi:hypothetical protein HIM_05387 [Hirsutella minnesotensis 3608]|uniref:Uncharacterized protein n=1 Tax=Hirsutella minnesotensis 3608 TaxID=1043627 RepID=A0A0F7ZUN9_9HYPO|nr:hypothetical protein HIM_05387 [Hirsutella minnesotensis 3608]